MLESEEILGNHGQNGPSYIPFDCAKISPMDELERIDQVMITFLDGKTVRAPRDANQSYHEAEEGLCDGRVSCILVVFHNKLAVQPVLLLSNCCGDVAAKVERRV